MQFFKNKQINPSRLDEIYAVPCSQIFDYTGREISGTSTVTPSVREFTTRLTVEGGGEEHFTATFT